MGADGGRERSSDSDSRSMIWEMAAGGNVGERSEHRQSEMQEANTAVTATPLAGRLRRCVRCTGVRPAAHGARVRCGAPGREGEGGEAEVGAPGARLDVDVAVPHIDVVLPPLAHREGGEAAPVHRVEEEPLHRQLQESAPARTRADDQRRTEGTSSVPGLDQ